MSLLMQSLIKYLASVVKSKQIKQIDPAQISEWNLQYGQDCHIIGAIAASSLSEENQLDLSTR